MNKEIVIFPFEDTLDRPNIVYLQGDNKSLLIDAGGGPKAYKFLHKNFEIKHLKNPDYVLLTHYHWDHMFGIGYFDSIGIASEYTNAKIKEHIDIHPKVLDDIISDNLQPEFCREHLMLEYDDLSTLKLRRCEMEVSNITLDLGNRVLEIYEVPSSHTEGSLIVYDRNSETLFIDDADYGYIVGKEFYDDLEKKRQFISNIEQIPFKWVLLGHSNMRTRDEYFKEIEQ